MWAGTAVPSGGHCPLALFQSTSLYSVMEPTFFLKMIILCVWVPECISVYHMCACGGQKRASGFLREKLVLLTAEPSLQPQFSAFHLQNSFSYGVCENILQSKQTIRKETLGIRPLEKTFTSTAESDTLILVSRNLTGYV